AQGGKAGAGGTESTGPAEAEVGQAAIVCYLGDTLDSVLSRNSQLRRIGGKLVLYVLIPAKMGFVGKGRGKLVGFSQSDAVDGNEDGAGPELPTIGKSRQFVRHTYGEVAPIVNAKQGVMSSQGLIDAKIKLV